MTYLRALDAAGAIPVVLPPIGHRPPRALLDRLDGSASPAARTSTRRPTARQDRHAELGPTEPSLDAFELALARAALQRGLPILAICRGSQALNVACGGTLHQHVPGHRQTVPATEPSHEVEIYAALAPAPHRQARTLAVNSFHHQAVDRVGDGLSVVARADGRHGRGGRGRGFVVGVQWHAEALAAHLPLFEALVTAASRTELRAAA